MGSIISQIYSFISHHILLIIVMGIIILHSIMFADYVSDHRPKVRQEQASIINDLSVIIANGARNISPQILGQSLQNINKQTLQIGDNKIKLTLSGQQQFPVINDKKETPNILRDFSQRLDNDYWLNYDIGINEKSLIILICMSVISLLFLIFALFYIFSLHRFKMPLHNFKQSADKFGIDLNAEPIKIFGPQIIQEAANAMNQMQKRIQELVNTRTRMLASISHDLKTPITRLKLRADAMSNHPEAASIIHDLNEMEEMISSVLTFSYHDLLREKKTQFEFVSLIAAICENYSDEGHNVNFTTTAEQILYFGNRLALKRTFNNLIQNGIKYGNNVNVRLITDNNLITVFIEDQGPGIPDNELSKVLEPFYRSDTVRVQGKSGSGLGLSIAHEVITAHHGELTLANHENSGLQVKVTLQQYS